LTFIDPITVSDTVFSNFDLYFNDLELKQLRVIQIKGHGANRKPIAGFLSILESNIVALTIFEISDIKGTFFRRAMVTINSTSGLADKIFRISTKTNR